MSKLIRPAVPIPPPETYESLAASMFSAPSSSAIATDAVGAGDSMDLDNLLSWRDKDDSEGALLAQIYKCINT